MKRPKRTLGTVEIALPGRHGSGEAALAPEARPDPRRAGLLGGQPVRIRAEGDLLVAYGFGHQRIVLPAGSIGEVAVRAYEHDTSRPLLIHGQDGRVLLRAAGTWDLGDVSQVCQALDLPWPTRRTETDPRPRRARGYRRLRARPRGTAAAAFVMCALQCCCAALGLLSAGLAAWAVLPPATGSVRTLIAIAATAAGGAGGWWLSAAAGRALLAVIRWSAASLAARGPAPAGPYFRRRHRPEHRGVLRTMAMLIAVPALIYWGPVVGTLTLVHGLNDQRLVSLLRHHGVPVTGHVVAIPAGFTQMCPDEGSCVSVPAYGTGLRFTTRDGHPVLVRALKIAGQLPPDLPSAVTIIYDPADPAAAAVSAQLPSGSVWAGAPAGNLVSGALLTAALPLLVWRLVPRLRIVYWHMQRIAQTYHPEGTD